MSSIIAQRDGGTVRVLDEIVLGRASTLDACEEFVKRYAQWARGLVVYADASAYHMQTAGTSDYNMLRDFFAEQGKHTVQYRIPRSNPSVQMRVRLVNGMLKAASGETTLLVDPRCKELMADFDEVSFARDSLDIDKDSDTKRTHLSDALGYLVWQEFGGKLRVNGERGKPIL